VRSAPPHSAPRFDAARRAKFYHGSSNFEPNPHPSLFILGDSVKVLWGSHPAQCERLELLEWNKIAGGRFGKSWLVTVAHHHHIYFAVIMAFCTEVWSAGHDVNVNGGVYCNGAAYTMDRKLQVAMKFRELVAEIGENAVSSRKLGKEAGVSHVFAQKVINECKAGGIIDPSSIVPNRPYGVGSIVFDARDEAILLDLRNQNPQRTLDDYRRQLYRLTGTDASESTICEWFLRGHDFAGGMRVSNLVPRDKFTDENVERFLDYQEKIQQLDPRRIKFGDEKLLKGAELYSRKVRRCPQTGKVEDVTVDSDFRNTYSIVGFCGIDQRTAPFQYTLYEYTNDASAFCKAVEEAVENNFLLTGDALVLDNASYHRFGEAASLEDWLWEEFRILLIYLPTRSPELNPIELLWHTLVQRLKNWPLAHDRPRRDAVAFAAASIMASFTHADVAKTYHHCNYIS